MIKVVYAATRKPGVSLDDLYAWWHDVHGLKEFGRTDVRRYVQQFTLPETRNGQYGITPNQDGASMGWFDDMKQMQLSAETADRTGWTAVLFGPSDIIMGAERVLVNGKATPSMVKLNVVAKRNPDLSVEEFQRRWLEEYGPVRAKIPGLRRYVQNHPVPEGYTSDYRRHSHDAWSEEWFDDLESLRIAVTSPEAQKSRENRRRALWARTRHRYCPGESGQRWSHLTPPH
jgi:uncharacterized protein (TIGR02118 family)